jgi:thiamine biosynthesis lipoprotein
MSAAGGGLANSPGATSAPPGAPDGVLGHTETAMGTVFSFTVETGALRPAAARQAIGRACRRLHRLERIFTTWDPASPMSRLRRGELSMSEAPPEVPPVLDLCAAVRELSGGWFDPWAMPGGVDPTGLVKGWAIERALEVLEEAGVPAALLNGGGDIAALGRSAGGDRWRIGVRHPWRADALACVVFVDHAVATSGAYERGPHLVDPRSGRPAPAAASATVTGPSLAIADGLTTALAVGGSEVLARLEALAGYEGYLVGADGTEAETSGMAFADEAR